jgi:hypothetical protein
MNRHAKVASACAAIVAAALCIAGFAAPRTAQTNPIRIDVTFNWSSGTHDCDAPRLGSVICVMAKGTVSGLGDFEYARDGVPTGGSTTDGCSQYSTHGTIFVTGGTAAFDGTPATTCGGTDVPDAHYDYTISGGTGILVGATGSGDIVADHGVDKWHGSLDAAGLHPKSASSSSSTLVIVSIATVVAAGAVALVVLRRRAHRSTRVRE